MRETLAAKFPNSINNSASNASRLGEKKNLDFNPILGTLREKKKNRENTFHYFGRKKSHHQSSAKNLPLQRRTTFPITTAFPDYISINVAFKDWYALSFPLNYIHYVFRRFHAPNPRASSPLHAVIIQAPYNRKKITCRMYSWQINAEVSIIVYEGPRYLASHTFIGVERAKYFNNRELKYEERGFLTISEQPASHYVFFTAFDGTYMFFRKYFFQLLARKFGKSTISRTLQCSGVKRGIFEEIFSLDGGGGTMKWINKNWKMLAFNDTIYCKMMLKR